MFNLLGIRKKGNMQYWRNEPFICRILIQYCVKNKIYPAFIFVFTILNINLPTFNSRVYYGAADVRVGTEFGGSGSV
jgi:hypothetical protein